MEQQTIDLEEFKKEIIEEITKNVMIKIKDREKEIIELFLNIQEKQKKKELDIILDLKKELLKEQELKIKKEKEQPLLLSRKKARGPVKKKNN